MKILIRDYIKIFNSSSNTLKELTITLKLIEKNIRTCFDYEWKHVLNLNSGKEIIFSREIHLYVLCCLPNT